MKSLIIIIFITISNNFLSQEISGEEYRIYAQLVVKFNYPPDKLYNLSKNEKNSLLKSVYPVERKIGKIESFKNFDISKLKMIIDQYRIDKSIIKVKAGDDVLEKNKQSLSCSTIYFKSKTEAYIYVQAKLDYDPKPVTCLFKATKQYDGYWSFEDFIRYY